jgi:hypothetical protein
MTKEEKFALEVLALAERFLAKRPHETRRAATRQVLRSAVPAAVNAAVLFSLLRGMRSKRRLPATRRRGRRAPEAASQGSLIA